MKIIDLTEHDFKSLSSFLKESFFLRVFSFSHFYENNEKQEVDYGPVEKYLSDTGVEIFKKNVTGLVHGNVDDFTEILNCINNAFHVANTIDTRNRFNVFLQRTGMTKNDFFAFLKRFSDGMPDIVKTDGLLSDLVMNYNKTHKLSLDIKNVEKDENAATVILKGLVAKSDSITTLCNFLYNVFSVLYGCQLEAKDKLFVSTCLKHALDESNLGIDALNSDNIRKLMSVKLTPNADFIANNADDIKADLNSGVSHIV